MSAEQRLVRRLAMVAMSVDAGRYPTPEQAGQEILDVLASIWPEHRADLLAWVDALPPTGEEPDVP